MSIVSHLEQKKKETGSLGFIVRFLYTTRSLGLKAIVSDILFLERLASVFESLGNEGKFELFLTKGQRVEKGDGSEKLMVGGKGVVVKRRRIMDSDLLDALGPVKERKGTVCYICGVPTMTDQFVEKLKKAEGMEEGNVLSEKWW